MSFKKRSLFDENVLYNTINPVNQQYVDEYVKYLKDQKKNKSTIERYLTAYDRVFKYKENWDVDFKDYNDDIYMRFQIKVLDLDISTDRIDFFTSVLSNLGKYLQDKYPEKFDRNFLKYIERINAETSKNIPPRALKMYELDGLKEFLEIENNNKAAYVFYIYYHYDIKKADFKYFDPTKADIEEGYFEYGREKVYFTNEIYDALNRGKKIDSFKLSTVDYYFAIMTKHMQDKGYFSKEQTFTFDNIKLTRNRYRMKCPCCGKMSENISENWVLVRLEDSKLKQIVCRKCKGEKYNEEI
jgi:hypothetical protein